MKNAFYLTLLALCLNATSLFGQITVGRYQFEGAKKFREGEFAAIKSKTTIFVADAYDTETFEKIFKEVWTFTPYKIVRRAEFEKNLTSYIKEENAIFIISSNEESFPTMNGNGANYTQHFYSYFYPTDIKLKKGKPVYEVNQIAQMFFYGTIRAAYAVNDKEFDKLKELFPYFKPGYFKNYLMLLNKTLIEEKIVNTYDEISDNHKLKYLKSGTLFVPELMKQNYVWGTGKRKEADASRILNEALEDYKFKYEFISDADLENKIMAGEQLYYIEVMRIRPFLIVSVADSKTGEIIFRSKRLDKGEIDTEFSELSKAINKS